MRNRLTFLFSRGTVFRQKNSTKVLEVFSNKTTQSRGVTITATVKSGNNTIYLRVTDNAGNQTVIRSAGIKGDSKKPTITLKGNQLTVKDTNSKLKSIKVDGKTVSKKVLKKKTLKLPKGKHSITAVDRAGNKVKKTVTVR